MARQKKYSEAEIDVRAMAAASLRGEGHQQLAISRILKISQPEISRLLLRAHDNGWLGPPRFFSDRAPNVWKQAQAKFFACEKLKDRLRRKCRGKSNLQRVTFVPSQRDEELFDAFTAPIVDVIRDRLAKVETVGVIWGRTLSRLVALLDLHRDRLRRDGKPITFVPLCGEPLKDRKDPVSFSSSALAARLSEIFNGPGHPPPPSLAGVPIFIPMRFNRQTEISESGVTTIRRFIQEVAGYADVFGGGRNGKSSGKQHAPLVDRVELILTSVGSVSRTEDPRKKKTEAAEIAESPTDHQHIGKFLEERILLGDLTLEEVREWIAGDIGGVLIGREGLGEEARNRIAEMNGRWTGLQMRHLTRCAAQARKSGKPGVVVVATGTRRREIVERCAQLNLLSELIIDQELSAELTPDPKVPRP